MIYVNKEDKSISLTRGDTVAFSVTAEIGGVDYTFQKGDLVRLTVTEKKKCGAIVLAKDLTVSEESASVIMQLESEETKIGEVISKPVDYWYEIELNPLTHPQTIIGYDEDGPKIFRLYPEGAEK